MNSLTAKKLSVAEIDALVNAKVAWILSTHLPEIIYLFGSASTYEMTNASDIDLIVVYESTSVKQNAQRELFKTRPKDDWPHDLLLFTLEEFELNCKKGGGACWLAKREGKILYAKDGNNGAI